MAPCHFPENFPGGTMSFQHGAGWMPLLAKADDALARYGARVAGAKEKLGSCRAFIRGDVPQDVSEQLRLWIRDQSLCTCEVCGADGSMRTWGWRLQVRCDRCDDEVING